MTSLLASTVIGLSPFREAISSVAGLCAFANDMGHSYSAGLRQSRCAGASEAQTADQFPPGLFQHPAVWRCARLLRLEHLDEAALDPEHCIAVEIRTALGEDVRDQLFVARS